MRSSAKKRQNFDVTPEQEAEIAWLRETLGVSTTKDAVLRAVRITAILSRKAQEGREVVLRDRDGATERFVIPELERSHDGPWRYLVARPHPWKRQLFVKGTRVAAARIWGDLIANRQSAEEAAAEWALPLDAVREAVRYCEGARDLIAMEAREERRRGRWSGVRLAVARR